MQEQFNHYDILKKITLILEISFLEEKIFITFQIEKDRRP